MQGASWNERQPSDWLASNGRWYPASKYPRGWATSALPPAPGHGNADSILRKYASAAEAVVNSFEPSTPSDAWADNLHGAGQASSDYEPPSKFRTTGGSTTGAAPSPAPPREPGFSIAKSGRAVADATVTAQRTHAQRVGTGLPPPPQLANPRNMPAPPGRVRDDAPKDPPAPPTAPKAPTPASADHSVFDQQEESTSGVDVFAGDFGKIVGSARSRIEKALNDSYES